MAHRDIERLVLPDGFTLVTTGTTHLMVVGPDGEPLRMPNGVPVVVANTPSDRRTRRNENSRIRRAHAYVRPEQEPGAAEEPPQEPCEGRAQRLDKPLPGPERAKPVLGGPVPGEALERPEKTPRKPRPKGRPLLLSNAELAYYLRHERPGRSSVVAQIAESEWRLERALRAMQERFF